MIPRTLNLQKFKQSFFLFGPRQVGKTFLIKYTLTPNIFINLLRQEEYWRYCKNPSLLAKEAEILKGKKSLIVIDEIQRLPEMLNEVHYLMENSEFQFVLTGSSARKLRKTGVNLLGGRAITLFLHPLSGEELGEGFNLNEVLCFGSIPNIILQNKEQDKKRLLKSYVETYLKEEIMQEAITRNIPAFAKFLELSAFENGRLLNFNNLAREVGIHSKTIKGYFNILVDTLIGFYLYPYTKSHRTKHVSHPKFYFFDRGVVTALRGELSTPLVPGTYPYGDAFEHFVILEIKKQIDYGNREIKMSFFRTNDGAEVDLILEV